VSTFENIAEVIGQLLDRLIVIEELSMFVFNYGCAHWLSSGDQCPDLKIRALISQNGDAYEEGLGGFRKPLQQY
jgi:hypothetical protein